MQVSIHYFQGRHFMHNSTWCTKALEEVQSLLLFYTIACPLPLEGEMVSVRAVVGHAGKPQQKMNPG